MNFLPVLGAATALLIADPRTEVDHAPTTDALVVLMPAGANGPCACDPEFDEDRANVIYTGPGNCSVVIIPQSPIMGAAAPCEATQTSCKTRTGSECSLEQDVRVSIVGGCGVVWVQGGDQYLVPTATNSSLSMDFELRADCEAAKDNRSSHQISVWTSDPSAAQTNPPAPVATYTSILICKKCSREEGRN